MKTILALLLASPMAACAAGLVCGPTQAPLVLPQIVSVPNCPAGQVLTGDGVNLSCVLGGGGGSPAGLPANPSPCASGQFVIDQDATGVLQCAQVQWSQIASVPPLFTPAPHTHQGADIVSAVPSANTVPWSGLTATSGTPSSSTFLRGDGAWSAMFPGVASNGSNGLAVTGAVSASGLTLSAPLPQAQGGTGAPALTCASGQHLTSNGTTYSCTADSGTSYTGVTSDGSNGLTIVGAVDIGTGSATRLGITPLTVAQLLALADMVTWDMAYVSDGASASDCATGGGTYTHWCHYTGSAWATDAVPSGSSDLIAALPTFSPVAGGYTGTQSVTLSSTTSGATICYTTTGSAPAGVDGTCTAGSAYSGAISVSTAETIKAVATKAALLSSPIASAAYTINTGIAFDSTAHPGGAAITKFVAISGSDTMSNDTAFSTSGASEVWVAVCMGTTAAAWPPTVTATCGGGACSGLGSFTMDPNAYVNGNSGQSIAAVFHASATGSLSNMVVTATRTGTGGIYWGGMGIAVLHGASATAGSYGTLTRSSTVAPLSITTAGNVAAGSWVFGCVSSGNWYPTPGGTMTAGTGTVLDGQAGDANYDYGTVWRSSAPAAGGAPVTLSINESSNYNVGVGLEIKVWP